MCQAWLTLQASCRVPEVWKSLGKIGRALEKRRFVLQDVEKSWNFSELNSMVSLERLSDKKGDACLSQLGDFFLGACKLCGVSEL